MHAIKWKLIKIFILALLAAGCSRQEKLVTVNGSATMGPLIKKLIESFSQTTDRKFQVTESGSLKGLSLLLAGKNDIAVSSVKMPPELLWEARKNKISIKEYVIGYDIIIVIIHPSNCLDNLFQGRIADMYTGLITDWKEVEGKSGKITAVDREKESGTKRFMSERFIESTTVVEGGVIMKCDNDVIAYVSRCPGSIGYISKSFIVPGVKPLNINGYSGTVENVQNKGYPLYRELYIYVNENSLEGPIKLFIDYVLGNKGQEVVGQHGFVPLAGLTIH